jgi:hypothetical protein
MSGGDVIDGIILVNDHGQMVSEAGAEKAQQKSEKCGEPTKPHTDSCPRSLFPEKRYHEANLERQPE